MKYLALLRGINVGGNNIIKMANLKASFEKLGCTDVSTYIQSGNVIFSSSKSEANLSKLIESALSKTFGYKASIVLIKQRELKRILDSKPKNFGSKPTTYRYDVMFLKKTAHRKTSTKRNLLSRRSRPSLCRKWRVVFFPTHKPHKSKPDKQNHSVAYLQTDNDSKLEHDAKVISAYIKDFPNLPFLQKTSI